MFGNVKRALYSFINILSMKCKKVVYGKNIEFRGIVVFSSNKLTQNKIKYPRVIIGDNVTINSSSKFNLIGGDIRTIIHTIDDGTVIIGNNVGISNSCIVSMNKVIIEDDVMIGGSVKIYDCDFHPINYHDRVNNRFEMIKKAPVTIKKGAFIGAGTYILKGVTIGERAIVGAGSVVTKDIADDEVWAGNPAVFVRKNM